MTEYRLKPGQESFTVADGPFAGKSFEKGLVYTEIPPQEARRFSAIKPQAASDLVETAKKGVKK